MRFPGLISAVTTPSGGTSDYAPEMIHAAARGEPYSCFVRRDTQIPYMAMPDAIEALLRLASGPRERLTRTAYNLTAFSPTAEEICEVVTRAFPRADVRWETDLKRQRIVDSWPADVDDSDLEANRERYWRESWEKLPGTRKLHPPKWLRGAFNWYFHGHQWKWATDFGVLVPGVGGGSIGGLSVKTDDPQIQIRSMAQLTF